jgi:predicted nucleotidyltransferase
MALADKLEIAKRWTEKVVDVLKDEVLEISLFGSVARSIDREGSDIDLLIVVSGERKKALDVIFDKLGDAFLELVRKGSWLKTSWRMLKSGRRWREKVSRSQET